MSALPIPSHMRHYMDLHHQIIGGGQLPPGTHPQKPKIKFVNPNTDNYEPNIRNAAKLHKGGIPMMPKGIHHGETAIVCGSGPSLRDPKVFDSIVEAVDKGAKVVACKDAVRYLHSRGVKVDYSVTMDPGAHIARPDTKIARIPGVIHLVASSSDPLLFEYLLSNVPWNEWFWDLSDSDKKRVLDADMQDWIDNKLRPDATKDGKQIVEDHPAKVWIFHSATGLRTEVALYGDLFSDNACMGGGYNVVNRAISCAYYMGFDKIILAGADSGWRPDDTFYVDGDALRKGVDMCDNGVVDGKPWMTRPDMLASGVALARLAKKNGEDKFVILGDTLPAALRYRDEDFLKQCANFG